MAGRHKRAVHAPARIPQQHLAIHIRGAAGGGGEVVTLLAQPRDDAIVAHDAALVEKQSVTCHADAQVGKTTRVHPVEKCAGIRT
jgi:hypothetical protein